MEGGGVAGVSAGAMSGDDGKYYVDEKGCERVRCRKCGCWTVEDVLAGELVVRCTICDWRNRLRIGVPDRVPAEWSA